MSSTVPAPPPPNSAIMLCPDGVYRWVYEFSLYRNPTILFMLYKIFGGIFAVAMVAMLLFALDEPLFQADPIEYLTGDFRFMLLFVAFWFALVTVSYYIYAAMQGGKYCVSFEMDESGVTHRQHERQIEKAALLGAITVMAGVASGNLTTMGIGLTSGTRYTMSSDFLMVRSIKAYKKRGVIKVNEPLSKNQVYADGADFDFVLGYIVAHCPNAQVR